MIDPPSTQPPTPRSPSSSLTLWSPTENEVPRSCPPSVNRLSVVQYNLSPDPRASVHSIITVSITQESPLPLQASYKPSPEVSGEVYLALTSIVAELGCYVAEVPTSSPSGPILRSTHTESACPLPPGIFHRGLRTRYVAQSSAKNVSTLTSSSSSQDPSLRHRSTPTKSTCRPRKRSLRAPTTSFSPSTYAS